MAELKKRLARGKAPRPRYTSGVFHKSNDLGAPRKTICVVAESMRGWPAHAHP